LEVQDALSAGPDFLGAVGILLARSLVSVTAALHFFFALMLLLFPFFLLHSFTQLLYAVATGKTNTMPHASPRRGIQSAKFTKKKWVVTFRFAALVFC
jgi:hypothetical protein